MMFSKRHLPDIKQRSQRSGSNVIPRRARLGLAGLEPHNITAAHGGLFRDLVFGFGFRVNPFRVQGQRFRVNPFRQCEALGQLGEDEPASG